MFCPNCGKQIPDNAAFCSECGKPTNTVSAPEPTPVATPTIPVGKIKYFTKVAPTSKRIMAGIALGLGLLCILFVFLSANTTVNGSIFETPIFSLYNEDSEEIQAEFDQIAKDLENLDLDELEDALDEFNIDFDEVKDFEKERDEILDLITPLSFSSAVELCEKYGNANNESIETVKTVISVIWTYCLILIALTALGVLFQKTWLMILSHVLGMLFVIVTGGFVFFMLTTACYIAASILFKKVNYEYKVYKAACALGK